MKSARPVALDVASFRSRRPESVSDQYSVAWLNQSSILERDDISATSGASPYQTCCRNSALTGERKRIAASTAPIIANEIRLVYSHLTRNNTPIGINASSIIPVDTPRKEVTRTKPYNHGRYHFEDLSPYTIQPSTPITTNTWFCNSLSMSGTGC